MRSAVDARVVCVYVMDYSDSLAVMRRHRLGCASFGVNTSQRCCLLATRTLAMALDECQKRMEQQKRSIKLVAFLSKVSTSDPATASMLREHHILFRLPLLVSCFPPPAATPQHHDSPIVYQS